MSTSVKCILLLASSSLLLAAPEEPRTVSSTDRTGIERAVLDTSDQMTAVAQKLDVDGLFNFVLDNDRGSIIQSGNLFLTREQALASVKNGFQGIRKLQYRWDRQLVTVISPTVAILVSAGESTVTTESGQTFSTPFAQTIVFRLTDGRWRVLHAHQSTPAR